MCYIPVNLEADSEGSANEKATDKLVKLISYINVENNDETNISSSASVGLKASESNETSVCETIIEVTNLEPAIEVTNESISSLEIETSIVSNGHLTETDVDCKQLVSSDVVTANQTAAEVESASATIPEIGQSSSILDKVDGKDIKSNSDQPIKSETTPCIEDVPDVVVEELVISTTDDIKSNDQGVVEPIGDVITCPPAIKMEIDVAAIDDIVGVKNDAIESDQETSASSDQNVSIVTIPVKRSISEATTVSRTISDDIETKGNYCF